MIAPLAKFIDWSAIQALVRIPPVNEGSPRLEEAIQLLKNPGFIPAESQPARIEFDPDKSGRHFRFPTPRPGEFAENNVVYGRLYRCAGHWQERPVIVLLHGSGDSFGYRFRYPLIARRCNRAGFNAVTLVAPYHFQRRPHRHGVLSWPNYLRMAEATAQAIAEIRALTGWLLGEGCPAVSLWGFSFGGWLAGLTACHDARLAAVVLAAPRVRMNLAFPQVVFRRRIREVLQRERTAWETLNQTSLNLTSARPVIPKGNILLIETMYDLFVGREGIEDLWLVWGQPDLWRLPHGHVSKALLPGLTGRVLRWLVPRLDHSVAKPAAGRQNPTK
jgi:pimeloyl-ACP methyl ester carboxylesterase